MLKLNISTNLNDFTLDVATEFPATGISAVFGRSGSGKTTLLRCIAGFHACSGYIGLDDEVWLATNEGLCIAPHQRQIGYVFQDTRLFSHLDVAGNLRYAEKRAKSSTSFNKTDVIRMLDLDPLLQRSIQDLSGGERQRVALGRTLLTHPALLLLDEPFSALDQGRKLDLLPYIKTVCEDFDIPALFVSHAIDEVAQLASHTVVLNEGQLQATGPTADVLEHPGLQALTGRYESGAVLAAAVTHYDPHYQLAELSCEGHTLIVPVAHPPAIDSTVNLYVRARDVSVATTLPVNMSVRNVVPGKLLSIDADPATPFAELNIGIGRQVLHARVTRAAVAELRLAINADVFALIKSVSFDRDV